MRVSSAAAKVAIDRVCRCALVNRPLKTGRSLITAEDVLDLPVSSRVATPARLPLPVGSTTSVSVVIPAKNVAAYVGAVSYTHLTLPTIYSV